MKKNIPVFVLNIINIFVVAIVAVGVCWAILAVAVVAGIFGSDAFAAVMKELMKYAAVVVLPYVFIFLVTFFGLILLLWKSEKRVAQLDGLRTTFLVLYIICSVLSSVVLLTLAISCIYALANTSFSSSSDAWSAISTVIIALVLSTYCLITDVWTARYLITVKKLSK